MIGSSILYFAARYFHWNLTSYPSGVWYFDPFTWQLRSKYFASGVFLSFVAHLVLITVSDSTLVQLVVGACGLSIMVAVAYYRGWSKEVDRHVVHDAADGQTG